MLKYLRGDEVANRLYEAGLLPEGCTRVEIILDYNGDLAIIKYSVLMTEEVLQALHNEDANA